MTYSGLDPSDIKVTRTTDPEKIRTTQFIPTTKLPFGEMRSPHAFLMDYDGEWKNPRIVPYDDVFVNPKNGGVTLHLGAKVFQYGYAVFEGAKAFLHKDGEVYTHRLRKNAQRINRSARITCMPDFPEQYHLTGVHRLLDIDRLYVPQSFDGGIKGSSMYNRSFMFGTDDVLGTDPGNSFTFASFLSPSGPYYKNGFNPITLLAQNVFPRAFPGGTGAAKFSGNYAAAARAAKLAKLLGCSQSLFFDQSEDKLVEEVGTSAFGMLQWKNQRPILVLPDPELKDTILDSITSRSVEEIVKKGMIELDGKRVQVERRNIPFLEVFRGIGDGTITEILGLGTAAVVSAVEELRMLKNVNPRILHQIQRGNVRIESLLEGKEELYDSVQIPIPIGKNSGPFCEKLHDTYTGMQEGIIPDTLDFLEHVKRAA